MGKAVQTKLVCPECGNVFPIMRKNANQRPMYHRKWLYCIICQKVTNHIELQDYEMWLARTEFTAKEELTATEKEIYQLVKKRRG